MEKNKMSEIKQLNLCFPHGTTIYKCEEIVRLAEKIVSAGVSEGGFATTNHYGINVEDVTFSDDCMHYVFGHDRSNKEKCHQCGSTDFAIARDMTSKRTCTVCSTSWDYKMNGGER